MADALAWWKNEGFELLQSPGKLAYETWHNLMVHAYMPYVQYPEWVPFFDLTVLGLERGIQDLAAFLTEQKEITEDGEKMADAWVKTLCILFDPSRYDDEKDRLKLRRELIDQLGNVLRKNCEWLSTLAKARYPNDVSSQKLWVEHFNGLP